MTATPAAPTIDSLFGRTGKIDIDRDERAQRAVKAFRALQPTLTAYARVLTKNPRVRVEMAARDNGSTDGHRIFYRPPIELGDPAKHERGKCDKRDANRQLICPACRKRERTLVVIYHEIAHIAFGTFIQPSPADILDVIQQAIRSVGGWYGEIVKKRIEVAPAYKTKDFINLASLISEYLPIIYNALEDARVNRELFRARQGVKVMFDADTWRVFTDGVEQVDPLTGEIIVKSWREYSLNMQVIVGVFCRAADYDYANWFVPQVIEALNDDTLAGLIAKLDTIRNTKGVYYLSFPILARLIELGYCIEERDQPSLPEPPPEAEEPEEDADEDNSDDGSSDEPGDDSGDSDADPDSGMGGSPDPDDQEEAEGDQASTEAPDDARPESGEGEAEADDEGEGSGGDEAPEDSGEDAGEPEASDVSDEPGDGPGAAGTTDGESTDSPGERGDDTADDSPESEGPDDDGAEPNDGEPGGSEGDGSDSALSGQPDGANAPSGDTESVDSDPTEQDKSGITGPGESVSTDEERTDAESPKGDSSESGSRDDEADSGSDESETRDDSDIGDGGEEVDEKAPGDSGASSARGDSERPGDASGDHSDPSSEATLVPNDDSPGQSDPGEADSDVSEPATEAEVPTPEADDDDTPPVEDDPEPLDQGADDGTGGIEVEENAKNDDLPMGTAEEARIGLIKWGGHDEKPKTIAEGQAEDADKRAVDRAVVQGIYFETPSRNIFGVREHHYGRPIFAATLSPDGEVYCMSRGWDTDRYSGYTRSLLGIDAETETEESILGGALLKMRVAFADNQRGGEARHRKSGKIDGRVLGRRASLGDDRLFKKRELPGKRNYFVLIGVDISGSTAGVNLVLAKKAAFAQANLLTRMGIPFAIYCHSGNFHDPALGRAAGLDLDIYIIKAPSDVWDKHTQKRLLEIGPDSANLDGHTLEFYRKVLDGVQATDKILLYYTDGKMPAENHDEELEILQRELKICKAKGYHVLGVGIRTDSPKRHGLNTVCVEEDKDIGLVIDQLRKELLAASARRG